MKKIVFFGTAFFVAVTLGACSGHSSAENEECLIHEGRISTHTTKSHQIHQSITVEEAELAKDHITCETAPGVSYKNIDAEGARMINESRKLQESK